ncbi:hypothetical protein HBI59_139890 [Parastagonospora nodorum]|nr:hypothetical protein HBI59_139890 [Parastagonospora nodorum]
MTYNHCAHKDTRVFDSTICCVSCGEIRDFVPEKTSIGAYDAKDSHEEEADKRKYDYGSLGREEFRLLVLQPGQGYDEICCRIVIASLVNPPTYTAVSYTWATEDGDISESDEIHASKEDTDQGWKIIKVTSNCANALRQVRDSRDDVNVWIDSICINQTRISERNDQVSMMGSIYKKALCVDVCINVPGQDFRDIMGPLGVWSSVEKYSMGLDKVGFEGHPMTKRLKTFFNLRYFSRVWVIQEVMLAKVANLHVNKDVIPFPSYTIELIQALCSKHRANISRISQWASLLKQRPSLVLYLSISMDCFASDPRDQVFAILGLLEPRIRALFTVDYTLSLDVVLGQAVVACIAECGDLGVLSFAGLKEGADISRSPSFGKSQFREYLAQEVCRGSHATSTTHLRQGTHQHISPFGSIALKASSHRYQMSTDDGGGSSGEGDIAIGSGFRSPERSTELNDCLQPPASNAVKISRTPGPPEQILPRLEVLAEFLCFCSEASSDGTAELLPLFEASKKPIRTSRLSWLINTSLYHGGDFLDSAVEDLENMKEGIEAGKNHIIADAPHIFRARAHVGFTASSCGSGDSIFLVKGAIQPLLLRKISHDVYRIVGPCNIWSPNKSPEPWKLSGIDALQLMGGRHIEIY